MLFAMPPSLGVFAGSGPFDRGRLEAGLDQMAARGFEIERAPGLDARHGYLAGDDDHRVRGIEALLDAGVPALLAARGGYGLTRIVGRLDPERFAGRRVAGFSDVTALACRLVAAGQEVLHGPVATQLAGLPDEDVDRLADALRGVPLPPLPAAGPILFPGVAEGPLWGGNLAVLAALVGTPWFRPPPGAIWLFEDVGEVTYRLDRMLTQLLDSGALAGAAGFALGDFTNCRPARDGEPGPLEVVAERLLPFGVPIVAGLPIGHGDRNATVVLGRWCRLGPEGLG